MATGNNSKCEILKTQKNLINLKEGKLKKKRIRHTLSSSNKGNYLQPTRNLWLWGQLSASVRQPRSAHLGADGLGSRGAERSSVMALLSLMLLICDSRPTGLAPPLWLSAEDEGAWG